jgi:hypothetical protein
MSNQKHPLLTRTLAVIDQAKDKGFVHYEQVMCVRLFEPVMHDDSLFINTACAILSMWLRDKKVYISIAPWSGEFSCLVGNPKTATLKSSNFGGHKTWEDAWITGIEEGLKLL